MDKYFIKCPASSEAYSIRGKCFYNMQRFDSAKVDFNKVIQLDKKNVPGYYYLAMSYFFLDKGDSCVFYINQAIAQKGTDTLYIDYTSPLGFEDIKMTILRYNRGAALYQIDRYNEALDDFNFAISQNYKTDECYLYIGLIALAKADLKLACKYLKKAYELGNRDALKYLPKECGI